MERILGRTYSEDKRIEKEQTDMTDYEWNQRAIKQLKDNKAPGQDGIPIELIKAGKDATIKIITKICNNIWKTGKWPEDYKGSTFIIIIIIIKIHRFNARRSPMSHRFLTR